jgi:hypothetical protein
MKQVTTDELIRRLHTQLGAEVAISVRPVPPVTTRQQRQVNSSLVTNFPDAETYTLVPDAKVTVIWPTPPDDKHLAFVRRRLVSACGIWDHQTNHVYLVPEPLAKAPTPEQVARYMPWTMKALDATGCRFVILLGSRAVWVWRPDLKPVNVNGKMHVWRERFYVLPLPLPLSSNKQESSDWDTWLAKFGRVIKEGEDRANLLWQLGSHCMKCGGPLYMYDKDGVPWCRDHAEAGLKLQSEGVKKWGTLTINATCDGLFRLGEY